MRAIIATVVEKKSRFFVHGLQPGVRTIVGFEVERGHS